MGSAVHDIPESGLSTVHHATPEELEAIARALELVACSSLTATYTIMPTGGGHYRLSGRLQASLQQTCVVTLEPVTEDDRRDVRHRLLARGGHARRLPAARSISTTSRTSSRSSRVRSQVGRVVFECLAGAIDPFPRKADAALERVAASPRGRTDEQARKSLRRAGQHQGKRLKSQGDAPSGSTSCRVVKPLKMWLSRSRKRLWSGRLGGALVQAEPRGRVQVVHCPCSTRSQAVRLGADVAQEKLNGGHGNAAHHFARRDGRRPGPGSGRARGCSRSANAIPM